MGVLTDALSFVVMVLFVYGTVNTVYPIRRLRMKTRWHGAGIVIVSVIGMWAADAFREAVDPEYAAEQEARREARATADSLRAIERARADSIRAVEEKAAEAVRAATAVLEDRAQCLRNYRGGFHTMLNRQILARLNDPESYEHIQTRVMLTEREGYVVSVQFTARNAFGGRVRNMAVARLDIDECSATLVGIE